MLACVREKAANACPPLVVGVGVGATFDKVGGLAKRALMRPLGTVNPDPDAAAFEAELLSAINATGICAGALGCLLYTSLPCRSTLRALWRQLLLRVLPLHEPCVWRKACTWMAISAIPV